MKTKTRTLLSQTAIYLGVLTLVSQMLWFVIAAYFFINPIRQTYLQSLGFIVRLAQIEVERSAPGADFAPNEDFRIVRDSEPRPEFKASVDPFFADLIASVQSRVGESIVIRKELDQSALWIRFPARNEDYWVVVPKGIPPIPYFMLASVGMAIAVAIGGAYGIIYNLTKRLRTLTRAVKAFGRGEPTDPILESGPLEIRDLSRGFNQMAVDLQKLDDDRRLMLAGISHDLKTPLTRLRLAVELAENDTEPELAAGMVHDIEDMDSILKQFLDYARDGTEEPLVIADLNTIVSDACERFRASGQAIELTLGRIPPLAVRKLAIYRAVTNVVNNAVRYGRDDVRVETKVEGRHVSITVTDRGPGITTGIPTDYIKAFARENTSRSELGTGLGLAIVKRITRTHGGDLHLENRSGGGLLVRIDLPHPDVPATRA